MSEGLDNPIPAIQSAKHGGSMRWRPHALRRSLQRSISIDEAYDALDDVDVQVVEHYVDSQRPACLLYGQDSNKRDLHVVVNYRTMEIRTVYIPTPPKFTTPTERGTRK